MPISNDAFDSANLNSNPKVLDFLRRNKKAYTEAELTRRFGNSTNFELLRHALKGEIDTKFIDGDLYYKAKKVSKKK